MQAGRRLSDVHRKRPLPNHGLEKVARKRPERPNLEANCAAHGGCFARECARK
jgi:ribosomal protein L34E